MEQKNIQWHTPRNLRENFGGQSKKNKKYNPPTLYPDLSSGPDRTRNNVQTSLSSRFSGQGHNNSYYESTSKCHRSTACNTPKPSMYIEKNAKVENKREFARIVLAAQKREQGTLVREDDILEDELKGNIDGLVRDPLNIRITIQRKEGDYKYLGIRNAQKTVETTQDRNALLKHRLFHPKSEATYKEERATKKCLQSIVWNMGKRGIRCSPLRTWNKVEKKYNADGLKYFFQRKKFEIEERKAEIKLRQECAKRKWEEDKERQKAKALKLREEKEREELSWGTIVTPSCSNETPLRKVINAFEGSQKKSVTPTNQIVIPVAGRKSMKAAFKVDKNVNSHEIEDDDLSCILPLDNLIMSGNISAIKEMSVVDIIKWLENDSSKDKMSGLLYSSVTEDEFDFITELKSLPLDELSAYIDQPD